MNRARTARRRRSTGRGFTLIELVISISVMGLICTVIAAVVTTAFKNNPMVEIRTDTAHTLKGLVTWLPQDVDSTPPTGFDVDPTTATGCTSNPGKNVLRMEWTEVVNGTNTRYVANYRWLAGSTSDSIVRVSCSGTGAGPLGNTHTLAASGPLMKMTSGWTQGGLPVAVAIQRDETDDVVLVTFDVETAAGDIMHVDSAPKNPGHTLPPTTADIVAGTATTVLATTTTLPAGTTTTVAGSTTSSSTTTTTLPPCVVTGVSQSFLSAKNTDPNGNGKAAVGVGVLATKLTVNLTVSGFCTSIDGRAVTGAPNSELFRNFNKVSATAFTVTFPGYAEGSSELWADGTRTITFYSPNGTALGSTQLVVK